MAAVTTIASLAVTAASTANSFIQANKQKKLQQEAEVEADKALGEARKRLEVNYLDELSIPKEAYELERDALLSAGAQALQAGVEGSQRGAAATAGRVAMAQNKGQAAIRTAMGQELFGLEKMQAQEDSRLRDMNTALDLRELEGAQAAGQAAGLARQEQMQNAVEGVGSLIKGVGAAIPEYQKGADGRAVSKLNRQFNRAQRKGEIGGDVSIGEFGNLNGVTTESASFDQGMADMYGSNYTDTFNPSAVQYEDPLTFMQGMTPFEQKEYFKSRK